MGLGVRATQKGLALIRSNPLLPLCTVFDRKGTPYVFVLLNHNNYSLKGPFKYLNAGLSTPHIFKYWELIGKG